jgi:ArsR family transcriptional regulator
VCELAGDLEIAQPLLSFHLKTLKEAGLVADRKDGRWVHYSIVPDALVGLEGELESLREDAASAARDHVTCC